jgi:hypothetical protein
MKTNQYILSNVPFIIKEYSTGTLIGREGTAVPTLETLQAETAELNSVQWGVLSQLFLSKIRGPSYIGNVAMEGTHQREIVLAQLFIAHREPNEIQHQMNIILPANINLRTLDGIRDLFGTILLLAGITPHLSREEVQGWVARIDAVIPANALCVANIRSPGKSNEYPHQLGSVIQAWDELKQVLNPVVRATASIDNG